MDNAGFQSDKTHEQNVNQTPEDDEKIKSPVYESAIDVEVEPERGTDHDTEPATETVYESAIDVELEPEKRTDHNTEPVTDAVYESAIDVELEPERGTDHNTEPVTGTVNETKNDVEQEPKRVIDSDRNGFGPETGKMALPLRPSKKLGKRPFYIFFVVVFSLGFAAAVVIGLVLGTGEIEDPLLEKYTYNNAAVAADHISCSEIGSNILKSGGTAADAGIAAMICVGLVNCHSAGIGGGHFSIFYNRTSGTVISINAREKAPAMATEDMFVGTYNASTYGGRAIAVPGEIKGFYELHERAGRLPWRKLFEPTIKLANDGFPVGGALAKALRFNSDIIKNDKDLREVFVDSITGDLLTEGDILKLPKLGTTLQIVADSGTPDPFYTGELSKVIAKEVQGREGNITTDDLRQYTAEVNDSPLMIKLDSMTMYTPRPPASGAVASFILNILDGYDFSSDSVSKGKSGLTYHRITEAFKFGYARRSELGDEDFEENVEAVVEQLISDAFAEETRMKIIDEETQDPKYYGGDFTFKEDSGTTHVSVIDAEGNALALSSTINLYLGAKVVGNTTGIFYNNEMDDFSTPNTTNNFGVPASPANFIKPGKRPMSSMVPIVIVDSYGDVRLVTGGAGGTTITTSSALVVMHSLWFKDNVREAVERKRIHHQLYPLYVELEERIADEIVKGLHSRKHDIETRSTLAVIQLVTKEGGKIYACSDPRKSGHGAAGY